MKLLKEPLAHFLVLGAGLFLLFQLVGDTDRSAVDRIIVTTGQIEQLTEAWSRTWQRPPTQEELNGLIDDYIREEVYYREALAMGLDRDDTIVRRRLRQKLEFFTDDLIASVDPTDEQLDEFLAEHSEMFRIPPSYTFEQIYFSTDRRGERANADAEALLAQLNRVGSNIDPTRQGDSLMIPGEFLQVSEDEVARRLGSGFATSLAELAIGDWSGPVQSGFGLHLVRVRARVDATQPNLPEVRDGVERDWRAARRREATEVFYEGLRDRYEVTIETPDVDASLGDPVASRSRE